MNVKNLFLIGLSLMVLASCGKKNASDGESESEEIQERTTSVSPYSGELITGDDAEYIEIDMPAGQTLELKGSPAEEYGSPKFRIKVPLKVTKAYPEEVSYLRITLELLDENHESLETLSINSADKETLIAALKKGNTSPLIIGFDTSVFDSHYNNYLDKAKYYRIKDFSLSSGSPVSKTPIETEESDDASASTYSSGSSSSGYEYDDTDYSDDADEKKESKMSKMKTKVKEAYEKGKETYNEKYKDKVDDAKEKVKDKWNELFD